jgi:TonB family protein
VKATVQAPAESSPGPSFLVDWEGLGLRPKRSRALQLSAALHAAGVLVLLALPDSVYAPRPAPEWALRIVTPLYLPRLPEPPPRAELTQRAPNTRKPSTSFELQDLLPRPRTPLELPPAPRRAPSPPPGLPEPPRIETAETAPKTALPPGAPGLPVPPPKDPALLAASAPQPPSNTGESAKPKLAFEDPNQQPLPGTPGGTGRLAVPSASVEEAVRSVASSAARGPSGGLMVGDAVGQVGGIGEMAALPPSPAKSALELLSDPQGVDFKPYLVKVLASVRRNWYAVMPESAKLGRRGRVAIQFAVDRNGRVPKLVIVTPSGTDALDRAAVAGISASNPFPPLPSEFRGGQIRLQLTFLYNMPSN